MDFGQNHHQSSGVSHHVRTSVQHDQSSGVQMSALIPRPGPWRWAEASGFTGRESDLPERSVYKNVRFVVELHCSSGCANTNSCEKAQLVFLCGNKRKKRVKPRNTKVFFIEVIDTHLGAFHMQRAHCPTSRTTSKVSLCGCSRATFCTCEILCVLAILPKNVVLTCFWSYAQCGVLGVVPNVSISSSTCQLSNFQIVG